MDQPRSLSATAELDLRWYGHHAGFFFSPKRVIKSDGYNVNGTIEYIG